MINFLEAAGFISLSDCFYSFKAAIYLSNNDEKNALPILNKLKATYFSHDIILYDNILQLIINIYAHENDTYV